MVLMIAVMALAGCSQNPSGGSGSASANNPSTPAKITGTVSTDGSTSMEKVIGALGEAFENQNNGVTFTYNPTGSGSGIQAVQEGRCDIGLSSRNLKRTRKPPVA